MPTYEYECKVCGHSFDAFQRMSEDPLKVCPQCGKELRRVINGGSGIIFKGSGFYVNDKNGGNSASKPAADKSAATDPGKTSSETGGSPGKAAAETGGASGSGAAENKAAG